MRMRMRPRTALFSVSRSVLFGPYTQPTPLLHQKSIFNSAPLRVLSCLVSSCRIWLVPRKLSYSVSHSLARSPPPSPSQRYLPTYLTLLLSNNTTPKNLQYPLFPSCSPLCGGHLHTHTVHPPASQSVSQSTHNPHAKDREANLRRRQG